MAAAAGRETGRMYVYMVVRVMYTHLQDLDVFTIGFYNGFCDHEYDTQIGIVKDNCCFSTF